MSAPTVLVMAAGTGGHIFPALSIARLLQAKGATVQWLGTPAGMENQVLESTGITLNRLPVSGLRGKGKLALIKAPFMLVSSVWQALALMRRIRPSCVLGMGGYVTGPGGLAAWLLRRPLIIHEQNAVAGLSNRLLAPLATLVLEAFPGTFVSAKKVMYTGNPVRADIAALGATAREHFDGNRRLRLLVLGGSLGAAALNETVPEVAGQPQMKSHLEVWHQTGKGKTDAALAQYKKADMAPDANLRVVPFIEDMAQAYKWADVVVCRAGAGTVFELAAAGMPSVLIPYPHAVDDHQTGNAHWLVDNGAAVLLPQGELNLQNLTDILMKFIDNPSSLAAMAEAALAQALPDAAEKLATVCLEVCHGR